MAWIEVIEPERAEGALKAEYQQGVQRAGKVYTIVKIQGLNPRVLHAATDLHGDHALALGSDPRGTGMLATVVSWGITASIERALTERISVPNAATRFSPSPS